MAVKKTLININCAIFQKKKFWPLEDTLLDVMYVIYVMCKNYLFTKKKKGK